MRTGRDDGIADDAAGAVQHPNRSIVANDRGDRRRTARRRPWRCRTMESTDRAVVRMHASPGRSRSRWASGGRGRRSRYSSSDHQTRSAPMSHSQLPTCATSCASSRRSFTFSSSSVRVATCRSRCRSARAGRCSTARRRDTSAATDSIIVVVMPTNACRSSSESFGDAWRNGPEAAQRAVHGNDHEERAAERGHPGAETERRPQEDRDDDEGIVGAAWGPRAEDGEGHQAERDQQRGNLAEAPPTSASGGRRSHSTISGATTIAPTVSPSHHVSQIAPVVGLRAQSGDHDGGRHRSTPQSRRRRQQ